MEIRRVDTTKRSDVRSFVHFPFDLYRDCPQWVPPLLSDEFKALDRARHPFYRHGAAEFFLAENQGRSLGRLAVMEHRPYNEHLGTRRAFFGLFETVDDREVASRLFEAAFDWARGQGLSEMLGTRKLGSAEPAGVLVEGFEHRPALGMPYNYAYYDALITVAGFEKESDNLSGYLSGDYELPERFFRVADRVKERRGLWVKTFQSKKELLEWVPRVTKVLVESFAEFPDSVPPTDDEIAEFRDMVVAIARPSLIKLAMKGDEVVGFLFAYPDISAALQRTRGRLWPFGWIDLLIEQRRTPWVNINGMGALPAYQGSGAILLLYTEVAKTIKGFGYQHADVVAVAEWNLKSRAEVEAIGVRWYKRHRNYRRAL
jgi:GNAT superfamily N-acetyltransferase